MPLTVPPHCSKGWLYMKFSVLFLLAACPRLNANGPGRPSYSTEMNPPMPVVIILKGHVLDDEGKGVPGIVVQVKGTNRKYVTDADGLFVIHDLDPDATLVFSGVNIETLEVGAQGKTELSVQVKYKVQAIADVVV